MQNTRLNTAHGIFRIFVILSPFLEANLRKASLLHRKVPCNITSLCNLSLVSRKYICPFFSTPSTNTIERHHRHDIGTVDPETAEALLVAAVGKPSTGHHGHVGTLGTEKQCKDISCTAKKAHLREMQQWPAVIRTTFKAFGQRSAGGRNGSILAAGDRGTTMWLPAVRAKSY